MVVATTIYETENCGGDNITPGEDVKVGQTLTSGWGCRCEANTNVPGAPRILDPPLPILKYLNTVSSRYINLTYLNSLAISIRSLFPLSLLN